MSIERPRRAFSRRHLLKAAGVAAAAGGGAAAALAAPGEDGSPATPATGTNQSPSADAIGFFGEHQAGISTVPQQHLQLAAFDVRTEDAAELAELLTVWTAVAAGLTKAAPSGRFRAADGSVQGDSGEATGHLPRRLTVTFGFGRSLFEHDGEDRMGLARRRPSALVALPAFAGDSLDDDRCGGDVGVQICGDDPQVVFHALHALTRAAHGVATARWVQAGFSRAPRARATPRNTLGFKDGTANIAFDDTAALREHVWVGSESDQAWMRGGSYLVARRVRTLLDVWDVSTTKEQESVIGRRKASGAPLGGGEEHDPIRLDDPALRSDAHVRLAAPESNDGARLLRRGYSYSDGVDSDTGQLDAGLVFIAFQKDPRRQFIPIQRRLAAHDALNKHVVHTGSALFACPPSARRGAAIGVGLL